VSVDLAALHEPYEPLLRAALLAASPPTAGYALDLASGPGLKRPWLAASLHPSATIVSLDNDLTALMQGADPALCADAHCLPFAEASFARCWCVAAYGLFAQPEQVLREVARVLSPAGDLVLTLAGQRWVCPRFWPAELEELVLAEGDGQQVLTIAPADGLGDELAQQLAEGLFIDIKMQAYLLRPGVVSPAGAALPLADWASLRTRYGASLSAECYAACEALGNEVLDPELVEVLFVVRARKAQ
jgi:SAM-dependent methyltransferase